MTQQFHGVGGLPRSKATLTWSEASLMPMTREDEGEGNNPENSRNFQSFEGYHKRTKGNIHQ